MTFVAHALVATWWSASPTGDPAFVLGAMLPDLCSMLGVRVPPIAQSSLGLGVRLHYRTDRVFHAAPSFREQVALGRRRLCELGLRPGRARAAAHVGVELLLDGFVAQKPGVLGSVAAALGVGIAHHSRWLRWPDAAVGEGFRDLATVLLSRDLAGQDGTPRAVAFRVVRAFRHRPLLRLDAGGQALVARWAEEAQSRVGLASDRLLGEVSRGLEHAASAAE